MIAVPVGSQYFSTTVDMNFNGRDFQVQIALGLNSQNGEVYAIFQSIDPATSLPPDVLTGFLPPEDGTGRGMGDFSYTIDPKADLSSGTEIRNVALIQFDANEVVATNQIDPHDPTKGTDPAKEALNTIDASPPFSAVDVLPATIHAPAFAVSWAGQDDAGGSGIANYDIYVSMDGEPYTLWLDDTSETQADFHGSFDRSYAFFSVATDNVGHREEAPTAPDAVTVLTNTTPVATVRLDTRTPSTNDTLTATATKSDQDGDPVSLTFVWKVNGTVIRTFTSADALTDTLDLSGPFHK
jgi:hypothetical protein